MTVKTSSRLLTALLPNAAPDSAFIPVCRQ